MTRVLVARRAIHPSVDGHPTHHPSPGDHPRSNQPDHWFTADHDTDRDPNHGPAEAGPGGAAADGLAADHGPVLGVGSGIDDRPPAGAPSPTAALQGRLRAAAALLPPTLGGASAQPLEVGRATRVVQPAQRSALAVRDRGGVFPGCSRPLAWCDAHHLHHWVDGGPTDLANLALLCRAHHRAVHEDGWRLTHQPGGGFAAIPPHRRPRTAA